MANKSENEKTQKKWLVNKIKAQPMGKIHPKRRLINMKQKMKMFNKYGNIHLIQNIYLVYK